MKKSEKEQKTSKLVPVLLLMPALLFGLISMALAVVGLGLIPVLPALAGILLSVLSIVIYKHNYHLFSRIVLGVSILAVVISVFRGVIIEKKVAVDKNFDSTIVKTQEGIDNDLNDAFSDSDSLTTEKTDTAGLK